MKGNMHPQWRCGDGVGVDDLFRNVILHFDLLRTYEYVLNFTFISSSAGLCHFLARIYRTMKMLN